MLHREHNSFIIQKNGSASSDYKRYNEGHYKSYLTVFNLFDEFGVENCKIEWTEHYRCHSNKELEAREGHHQQSTVCINKVVAGRTKQEWRDVNREEQLIQQKEYRETHKEEIATYEKEWAERNKETNTNQIQGIL